MFNVTVLKMRDIIKYLFGIASTIIIVMVATQYFGKIDKKENEKKEKSKINLFSEINLSACLNKTLPAISEINEEYNKMEQENEKISENNYLEMILETQISSIKGIKEAERKNNLNNGNSNNVNSGDVENNQNTNNLENNQVEAKEELKLAEEKKVNTENVTPNPIKESFNVQYGNVKIKNQTTYTLTEEMLKPDIKIDNKNIVIFHTHSCESYTPSEKYPYMQTGNFRTTDLNYTVTRVGTELENYLKKYNFNVVHDSSYHDYPSYNGSYTNSLKTVENILKTTPSDIIIDLHRDAIGSRPDYAPTVKIGDDYAAQIMFVIGTNEGGLLHPNWNQNLKFAVKVQQKAEEMYPGLFKPIMVTKSRYNQHTGKYANIMEIGATGNTLEQCLTSMKYLASVMNAVMNE